ncbi:MAG TPA: glycerol-3-phosphate 1-O-acyltransferase PlsY [Clostridiales bacterium]|nr:glycerol-3-phosphate 1-O-acyltransferase PlsY [Clostridiales bacterium]
MIRYIIAALIGYFVGNIASSYFAGKIMKNIDIREHGSGNAGATNTFRVLGAKAGVIVFICDILKGILAVYIGLWLTGDKLGGMLAGGAAILGHNWPVFLNFKGGKGIASSFGLILILFPKIGLILFLIAGTLVLLTRYVSVGSISGAILFPIFLVIYGEPWEICMIGLFLALIALLRHKDNIIRLSEGKENKITFTKKTGR